MSCVYCTIDELGFTFWYELQVTAFARVTSYLLHAIYELLLFRELWATFGCELRVTVYSTSCFLPMSDELLLFHELRDTFYIWVTSYFWLHELRVISSIWVTSYCLLDELWGTFYMRDASYCLLLELRVTF